MRNFQAESQEDSQAQEQIKRIIDSFNFEELRNFLNQEDNQIYKVQRLRDYLFKNISQCFDKVIIELQTNPTYDCSQLLIFIQENTNQGRRNNYNFRNLFNDYENLFKILEYTDDLHIYDLVFQILSNCIQIIHFDRQGFIPRLLYLEKIFYSHSNFLCSKKINLIDYYFMDPRYQEICNDPIESLQFDLEYYEPTQLDETYHELQRNGRHQKILSGIFQIKKIQIIDDNSTSALELSRNLLNMQTQSFSPLMDILKYRILINRGLQANSQQTKNIIIGLHLKSLNILKSQKEQFVALHIFERFYDDVIGDTIENNNFNLFQLETIDPIILVELLQIESRNNQQSSKRKQQFQLKLLSDVLSMRQIENNDFIQGYPLNYNSKILSESLAQDSQLTSGILIFLQIILNLQLILQ
ncbi:unnamed protein product [Paramecium octaurelia]|uniref:Uncharacterized protein n=1 Tax=Paramecium octaurelia TaxID=43137 RepID=A0A8S1STD4_PAROT|nr:unnamed protein product [Paramecium octaurelia]